MKPNLLIRKVHYWLSISVALPLAVIMVSGLLLQGKKWLPWVQPTEQRGVAGEPSLSLPDVLSIARTVPEAGVTSWNEIQRIDIRPSQCLLKVTTGTRWEIQIDGRTGKVLQAAYRRSDLIEAIHDGSWFGAIVRFGLFVPGALLLIAVWGTGVYLFVLPFWARWRRGRSAA